MNENIFLSLISISGMVYPLFYLLGFSIDFFILLATYYIYVNIYFTINPDWFIEFE